MIDLFTPVRLGRYTLPHRVVMAPMTRDRSPGTVPTDLVRLYYEQRASAALIVTEGIAPVEDGHGYVDTPGLYSEEQIAAWKRVTDAVHAKGGRIFAQLMHTGRISHPDFHEGRLPVAPSAVKPEGHSHTPEGLKDFVTPRYLKQAEIGEIIEGYAQAARNAIAPASTGPRSTAPTAICRTNSSLPTPTSAPTTGAARSRTAPVSYSPSPPLRPPRLDRTASASVSAPPILITTSSRKGRRRPTPMSPSGCRRCGSPICTCSTAAPVSTCRA